MGAALKKEKKKKKTIVGSPAFKVQTSPGLGGPARGVSSVSPTSLSTIHHRNQPCHFSGYPGLAWLHALTAGSCSTHLCREKPEALGRPVTHTSPLLEIIPDLPRSEERQEFPQQPFALTSFLAFISCFVKARAPGVVPPPPPKGTMTLSLPLQ